MPSRAFVFFGEGEEENVMTASLFLFATAVYA